MFDLGSRPAAEGRLVLLTMEEVEDGLPLMGADFRDSLALFHPGLGRFVGLDPGGAIRFGSDPEMVSGVWLIVPDHALNESRRDMPVSASDLSLRPMG